MAEVLPAQSPSTGSPYSSSSPLHHSPSPSRSFILDPSAFASSKFSTYSEDAQLDASSESSSVTSSPRPDKYSLNSTPPSSISLDPPEDDDEELFFPSYGDRDNTKTPLSTPQTTDSDNTPTAQYSHSLPTPTNESIPGSPSLKPADDTAVHDEPSRQVDYLSHDWTEEDVWHSWRHIVTNRKTFGERSRLENASWRTWTKSKYRLKTVSPEQLNWQKDCDVTWLYGPLQEARQWHGRSNNKGTGTPALAQSESASNMSKSNSFHKRPILKKRSVSEVMLQKSLSSSSLVKQAAAAVQAQRTYRSRGSDDRQRISRSQSDSEGRVSAGATGGFASMISSSQSSGLQSPEAGPGKHIRFDNKVEQCIAVDFKPGSSSDDIASSWSKDLSTDSSEEDLVMMKANSRRLSIPPGNRRDSVGLESKGIAKLPSTTLKFHHDELYCPGHPDSSISTPPWRGPRLQSSSSQETLRPPRPASNFLLDDGEDDLSWEPSGAFDTPRPGSAAGVDATQSTSGDQAGPTDAPSGLRRTPSGMFMPFEDEDRHDSGSGGVFGRVVDTVNTAKDIFSVIMNVGWRS